ncbi:hypothetical protein [Paracoccus ravus]|nr:hypothetical protein [Paracoccus ravus]
MKMAIGSQRNIGAVDRGEWAGPVPTRSEVFGRAMEVMKKRPDFV